MLIDNLKANSRYGLLFDILEFLKEDEFLSWEKLLQRNSVERNKIYNYVLSVIYRTGICGSGGVFCFNVFPS